MHKLTDKLQTLNHDITKAYLDIVTTYVSLMVLLSRVEDRKAVLGLFNAAHEMVNSTRYDSLNHSKCIYVTNYLLVTEISLGWVR
jgi:hypothetical protein